MSGEFPNTFYRVSVKGLVRDEDGHVLVIKEQQDAWSLPGGGLDHGEGPKEALVREFDEELGIRVAIGELAAVKTFMHPNGKVWLMWVVYNVELPDQNFKLGNGVTSAEFVAPQDLNGDDAFESMAGQVALEATNATLGQ